MGKKNIEEQRVLWKIKESKYIRQGIGKRSIWKGALPCDEMLCSQVDLVHYVNLLY